jgi:hypothetical protein
MAFDGALRVALETNAAPGSLNTALVTELLALDSEAKRLKKIGKRPQDELGERIDGLRANISRVRAERIADNGKRLDQFRDEYNHRRNKNAQVEIMLQNDARQRIAALDPDELAALATGYINDEATLNLYEIREITPRLPDDSIEEGTLHKTWKETIAERRVDQPWLEDPKAAAIVDEVDRLEATPPGKVLVETDDFRIISEVVDLVDFDGELSEPA